MEGLGLSFMAANIESFLADSSHANMTLLESVQDLVDLEYSGRRERTARTGVRIFFWITRLPSQDSAGTGIYGDAAARSPSRYIRCAPVDRIGSCPPP